MALDLPLNAGKIGRWDSQQDDFVHKLKSALTVKIAAGEILDLLREGVNANITHAVEPSELFKHGVLERIDWNPEQLQELRDLLSTGLTKASQSQYFPDVLERAIEGWQEALNILDAAD